MSAILTLISVIFAIPVFVEYFRTGLVPRFPTLIVCGFIFIAAIISFFSGMILDTVRQSNRQRFEIDLINCEKNYKEKMNCHVTFN